MNKQTKPKKFVTVRVDAKLAKALEKETGHLEKALNELLQIRTTKVRKTQTRKISKKVADSQSAFLEKYGSLSDEFGTL